MSLVADTFGSLRCWAGFILSSLSNKKYTRNRADRSIHPFTQPPTHPISSLMNPNQTPFPLIHFEVMITRIHVSFFPLVTSSYPPSASHPASQSSSHHLISSQVSATSRLLFLVVYELDVILRYLLILLQQELLDLVADVALHHDLLAAARHLGHGRARGELLTELLGYLSSHTHIVRV